MSARPEMDEQLIDQAIAWHQALAREDADWDGYFAWLEADPRHRLAFDEVALLDRAVDEHAPELKRIVTPPAEPVVRRPATRRWIVGSIAAALALAVGVPALWHKPPDRVYSTGRGESRHIALENGASVDLAPSSRLVVVAGDANSLALAEGEAYFSVRHDPARTLSIQAGDYAVTDIGTQFSVVVAPTAVTVGVAEGSLMVGADAQSGHRLSAGQLLVALRGGHRATVRAVAPGAVGSWRRGRLVYDKTPLTVVAADLARYSGKKIIVDPALDGEQFSGVLAIGDGSRLVQNLAAIMAITYRVEGDTIRLVAAPPR